MGWPRGPITGPSGTNPSASLTLFVSIVLKQPESVASTRLWTLTSHTWMDAKERELTLAREVAATA
jgi:hypothetical protein